jgi:hypothetical protein
VQHSSDEYVRGEAYTNTIEGVFSIFKRGMKGIYQHCSEKHLHRYLAEFDFRYNNRIALGTDDQNRAARALEGAKGKRLPIKELTKRRSKGFTNKDGGNRFTAIPSFAIWPTIRLYNPAWLWSLFNYPVPLP